PLPLFSFVCAARHPSLHSFPTRRSSDLAAPAPALSSVTPCGAAAVCAGAAVAATASTASAARVLRDREVVGDADVRGEGRHHRTVLLEREIDGAAGLGLVRPFADDRPDEVDRGEAPRMLL